MKIKRSVLSSFPSFPVSAVVLICSLFYSFSGIFFGLDFTDGFYHLNQALHPVADTYLYPFFLSSLLIKEIIDLVGGELIYLRVVNWILLVSSILLPFIFSKTRRRISQVFIYISIVLVLYAPLNANILGYDTLSIFILSLLFSVTVLYIKFRKLYYIFLLALICAAAVMIRLPNVLAVPIILFLLLISEKRIKIWSFKKISRLLTLVVLTFLLVILGYALYYSSWESFVAANPISESHNLLLLFSNYLKDSVRLIGYCGLILAALWGYKKLHVPAFPLIKEAILVLFFVFCLIFFVGHSKYSGNYSLFLVAVAVALSLKQIHNERKQNRFDNAVTLSMFLLFLFINPFGSNSGLLKAYSLILLVPYILSTSEFRNKRYWLILTVVLIPFSILTKIFGIYEDRNLLVLDEKLRLEKLWPIHTSTERAEYLGQVDTIVKKLKSKGVKIYFYGDKAHIFHYLYPETSLEIISFFQPVDKPDFLEEIDKAIKRHPKVAVFLVSTYPHTSTFSGSLLEQLLISMGCRKVKEDSVTYFFTVPN